MFSLLGIARVVCRALWGLSSIFSLLGIARVVCGITKNFLLYLTLQEQREIREAIE